MVVLTASGEMPKGLYIPKPPAPKVAAKPKAEVEAPVVAMPALKVLPPPAVVTATPAVTPAVAPTTTTPAPAAEAEATATACATALVNGVCPPASGTD